MRPQRAAGGARHVRGRVSCNEKVHPLTTAHNPLCAQHPTERRALFPLPLLPLLPFLSLLLFLPSPPPLQSLLSFSPPPPPPPPRINGSGGPKIGYLGPKWKSWSLVGGGPGGTKGVQCRRGRREAVAFLSRAGPPGRESDGDVGLPRSQTPFLGKFIEVLVLAASAAASAASQGLGMSERRTTMR